MRRFRKIGQTESRRRSYPQGLAHCAGIARSPIASQNRERPRAEAIAANTEIALLASHPERQSRDPVEVILKFCGGIPRLALGMTVFCYRIMPRSDFSMNSIKWVTSSRGSIWLRTASIAWRVFNFD